MARSTPLSLAAAANRRIEELTSLVATLTRRLEVLERGRRRPSRYFFVPLSGTHSGRPGVIAEAERGQVVYYHAESMTWRSDTATVYDSFAEAEGESGIAGHTLQLLRDDIDI